MSVPPTSPETTQQNFRLRTSPDLRKAMRSLIASFLDDLWEDNFGIQCTTAVTEEFREKLSTVIRCMYTNIDGKGTSDTLLAMREACIPTGWLVTFLRSCLNAGTSGQNLDFIETVIGKLDTIYTLLNSIQSEHFSWEAPRQACIPHLLMQEPEWTGRSTPQAEMRTLLCRLQKLNAG